MTADIHGSVEVSDNIQVQVHRIEQLRDAAADWEQLSRDERFAVTRDLSPVREYHSHNATTNVLHEDLVRAIDPKASASVEATHIALGTGDTPSSAGDTALDTEVFRNASTDRDNEGDSLALSLFVDTAEGNGNTLREVGTFDSPSGGTMLNRSLIGPEQKTNEKTLTVNVAIRIRNP